MPQPMNKGLFIDLGIDDSNFKKGLAGINQQLRSAQTQFNSFTKTMDTSGQSVDDLKKKTEAYQKVVSVQKNKVDELGKQLQKQKEAVENNAKATQKDKDALIRLANQYNQAKGTLAQYQRNLSKMEADYKQVAQSQNKFQSAMKKVDGIVQKSVDNFKKMADGISDAGEKMSAFASVPIGGAFTAAANQAKGFEDALTSIRVKTNATKEETKKMESAVKQAYTGVFAESAEQAAEAVSAIKINVGELNQSDLNNVTNSMLTLEQNGSDMQENIRGLKGMMEGFNISATEGMDLLSAGFQKGLDKTGELGDNMAEYAQLWGQMGFSASETFGILQNGLDSGAYNLDKVNDLIKEMGISLNDGRMDDHMNEFSQATQNAFIAYKNGSGNARDVIRGMISDISSMENKQKAASLASTMWSALGEDNALKVLGSMNKVNKSYDNVKGASKKLADANTNDFTKIQGAIREMQIALVPLGQAVARFITPIIQKVSSLAKKFESLPKGVQDNIVQFGLFAAATGPVLIAVGKLTRKTGGLLKGFLGMSLPAKIAIGALSAFGLSALSNMDSIEQFKNTVKECWNQIVTAYNESGLKDTISEVGKSFQHLLFGDQPKKKEEKNKKGKKNDNADANVVNQVSTMAQTIMPILNNLAKVTNSVIQAIDKIPNSVLLGVTGLYPLAKTGASVYRTYSNVKDSISGFIGHVKSIPEKTKNGIDAIKSIPGKFASIKEKANNAKDAIINIGSKVANLGNAKQLVGIKNLIGRMGSLLKNSRLVRTSIKLVSGALTFMTSPVGIAVGAIGGLVAIFITAYNKCDWFRNMVNKAMEKVKNIFKSSMNFVRDKVFGAWDAIKTNTSSFISNLKKGISSGLHAVKTIFSNIFRAIFGNVRKYIGDIYDKIMWLPRMVKRVLSGDMSIADAFKAIFNSAVKAIATPINGIIGAANFVMKLFNGKEQTFDPWKPPKLEKGTGPGGHPGGPAIINDEKGATYREAVILPNGQTIIPKERNQLVNLPKGTHVVPAKKTRKLYQYKNGTSFWEKAVDFGKNAIDKVKGFAVDVWDYVSNPKKLLDKVMEKFLNFGGLVQFPLKAAKGIAGKAYNAMKSWIKNLMDKFVDENSDYGGDVGGTWGDLGSNRWFHIDNAWVREWQYRLLEPIIKKYGFQVTDGGRRTWDNFDHSKNKAMDIALPGNPQDIYWKVAHEIDRMPLVSYVNSNLMSTYGHKGKFTPSNFEPLANHIHVSFVKEFLSEKELRGNRPKGGGGKVGNPSGAGVARWRPYVIRALRANGLPTTPAYVNAWMRQIQTESGGNPNALGGTDGFNEGRATGLLQVKPPTFNAFKHAGHGNIYNGYDNMLAAMAYAKHKYTTLGMLQVIGMGHGYEKGGLVTQHQLAQIAEGNKPEMVIPLTDTSRSVRLIRQAQRLVGEEHFEPRNPNVDHGKLDNIIVALQQTNELLKALLLKDTDVYLDGAQVSKSMDNYLKSEQVKRAIAQGTI